MNGIGNHVDREGVSRPMETGPKARAVRAVSIGRAVALAAALSLVLTACAGAATGQRSDPTLTAPSPTPSRRPLAVSARLRAPSFQNAIWELTMVKCPRMTDELTKLTIIAYWPLPSGWR